MAMKRGLDQTTAWIAALVVTLTVFGAGYGVAKWLARHAENLEDAAEHGEHGAAAEHGEHGAAAEHGEHGAAAKHGEHGAAAEHGEHGAAAKHGEHGAAAEHGEHGAAAKHGSAGEPAHANAQQHWEYKGSLGPTHWGELSKPFKVCATGKHQSPIDIDSTTGNPKLLPIKFHYQLADTVVKNNGHTVQLDFPRGNFVEIDGDHYDLAQLHFHTPSEHKVSGAPYELEMHLVHKNAGGKLAVIGVLFEEGPANKALAKLWSQLPNSGETVAEPLALNPQTLLPPRQLYYHYQGSLTTPPCTEGVSWYVLTQPSTVSGKQVETFAHIIPFNSRPPQPMNGRALVKSAR